MSLTEEQQKGYQHAIDVLREKASASSEDLTLWSAYTSAASFLDNHRPPTAIKEPEIKHYRIGPLRCICGFDAIEYARSVKMPYSADLAAIFTGHLNS